MLSGFKRFAFACHNTTTDRRQAGRISGVKALSVYHTHSIVASFTPPTPPQHRHHYSLLTGSTLSFSVTLSLSLWQLRYLALSRNMKRCGATSPLRAQQICQFISQLAIWQARLLLLKDVIQAHSRCHRTPLPSPLPFSLSSATFSLPLPPLSRFLHSISLSPCCNLWSFAS